MKALIEGAIQQFLDEKQRQVKLPEIDPPAAERQSQKSQKSLKMAADAEKTTLKSVSRIEI